MRWRDRSFEWKRRFAFIPHLIGDEWVWLEWYWRMHYGDGWAVSLEKPEEDRDVGS